MGNLTATIICLSIGIVLFIVEMFTPGLGIAGLLGAIALFIAVLLQIGNPVGIVFMIALVLFLVAVGILVFLRLVGSKRFDKAKIILQEQMEGNSTDLKEDAAQAYAGHTGITATPLRPAGKAVFNGKTMDVATGGEFLPAGSLVIIKKVEGLRILVQAHTGE